MNPGDFVSTSIGDVILWTTCEEGGFAGTFSRWALGVVLDAEFSSRDVYYYQVLAGGIVGWVRAASVKRLS
jgi:hypothetical protein